MASANYVTKTPAAAETHRFISTAQSSPVAPSFATSPNSAFTRPKRWSMLTSWASSTATSSRPICCWTRRGNLWITDFGLAHMQSQTGLTMTGDLVGTLRYMSPEQALAKRVLVDQRTDIYSLGATLYELLTLEPAFDGRDRQELLRQIAFEEPRPPRQLNKAIPQELETVVLKAMGKDPGDRYATAQELADDLGASWPINQSKRGRHRHANRWSNGQCAIPLASERHSSRCW